jgi:aminoglycoside phosphotransferase (APT) family kinase protein
MSAEAQAIALDDFKGALDWSRLNDWITTQDLPGQGPVTAVQRLRGGMQNQVFLLERDGGAFVLRRPPVAKPGTSKTMVREARVLKALAGTEVPHPELYALCEDTEVTGATFYCMEPLEGFAPGGALKGAYEIDPAWRRAMGGEFVAAAAALAAIDLDTAGLADLGKPADWHERQVERWRTQLEGYTASFAGYDPKGLPHFDNVGRWLSDNLPSGRRIGLVHGDFQFANVMFSLKAPRISGVVDWELASLGDPLLDLGWVLTSWTEEGDPPGRKPLVQPWEDFGSRTDLVRRYGEITGRDMAEMDWFFALACYKLACLLEGTVAASKVGKVPADVGAHVHSYASWLTTKARQIIAS